MWRVSFPDFAMWNVAFWATICTNATLGIFLGVTVDMVTLLYRTTRPSYSVLGRLEGDESVYRDRKHWKAAEAIPGVLIYRFHGSMHFANRDVFTASLLKELRAQEAEHGESSCTGLWRSLQILGEAITERLEGKSGQKSKYSIHSVVLDCSPITHVDITASRTLDKLRRELCERGIHIVIAHCKYDVYRRLLQMNLFEPFEETRKFDVVCFRELHDAVLYAEGRHPSLDEVATPSASRPMSAMLTKTGAVLGSNDAESEDDSNSEINNSEIILVV